MRIRRASTEDLGRILAIEAVSFPDPWPEEFFYLYLDDVDSIVLVSEAEEVLGFLIAVVEDDPQGNPVVHIHDLAVDPAHRRRGVATALLDELIRIAREQGIRILRLEVRFDNPEARAFYQHHGFRETGCIPLYYEDGGDAYLMERDLSASQPR